MVASISCWRRVSFEALRPFLSLPAFLSISSASSVSVFIGAVDLHITGYRSAGFKARR
jgi:hypothetical protein